MGEGGGGEWSGRRGGGMWVMMERVKRVGGSKEGGREGVHTR